MILILTKY